jgi:hypothetical protein
MLRLIQPDDGPHPGFVDLCEIAARIKDQFTPHRLHLAQ